ncbi:hypothetical protein [Cytobacillus sp. IB215665]|uniref:hypothetical protein n=1 Tax=Cytobacillus sp. IB215665 TaxID=3097357 RepID=UPI002A166E11|nr:hypothetical protein [Cytobacillus sp. IB215665]MDX8367683.1 hypothetical protein [Cytobacillus sp. IB215665]
MKAGKASKLYRKIVTAESDYKAYQIAEKMTDSEVREVMKIMIINKSKIGQEAI